MSVLSKKTSWIIAASLLSIFAATLFLCSGCGTNSAGSGIDTPVTLVYYTIGDKPKDADKVIAEMNKYLKEKINASVDIRFVGYGDYGKKLNTITAAGEKYDLAFTCSWVEFNYSRGVANNYFVALDEYFPTIAKGVHDAVAPVFWDGSAINGKHYAVPCNKEAGTICQALFNMNLVKKFGLDIDTVNSYASLEPLLAKVHSADPSVICLTGNDRMSNFDSLVNSYVPGVVKVSDQSLKVLNQYEDPDFIAMLEKAREYEIKGYYMKEAANSEYGNKAADKMHAGRVLCDIQESGPDPDRVYSNDCRQPIKTRQLYPNAVATTGTVTGSMIAISALSDNPERAAMFLNLLNTDKYLRNLYNYGIEGVHYKKTGENEIEMLPEGKDYNASGGPNFTQGNYMILYTVKGGNPDLWKLFEKLNATCLRSPALGFTFDVTPVKSEIAALSNIGSEMCNAMLLGQMDLKTALPLINQRMRAAGMDKVLAEMQKQLDTWRAKRK